MFCQQCGSQLSEGSKFCHVCGMRIPYTDQAQQVAGEPQVHEVQGNKAGQQSAAEINNPPVQTQEKLPSKSGKKHFSKRILIWGIIVVIVVILFAVAGSFNKGMSANLEVNLSKTYTNETQGIVFQYPGAWDIVDAADYLYSTENIVVLLANENDQGINSMIRVMKFSVDQESIDHLFIDDEEFSKTFDDDVTISETYVTTIDGIKARMIAYVEQDDLFYLSYFYGMGSNLYRIDFICNKNWEKTFRRFYDAVMESYTITATVSTNSSPNNDICYDGISVSNLISLDSVEVVNNFGYPNGSGGGVLDYKEITFYMWDDLMVDSIVIYYPEYFSVNGSVLSVNGDGSVEKEAVTELLGENYEDEWLALGYYITYRYPTYTISFCINKYNEVEHILIRNPLVEEKDRFYEATFDDTTLESYYGLAGFYEGSTGQSTLSLSIYSSQEEGETAIGTAVISEESEISYSYCGEVFTLEKDVYKVVANGGEIEVLLVVSMYNGNILIQLYNSTGEECIEEYHMVEAYES